MNVNNHQMIRVRNTNLSYIANKKEKKKGSGTAYYGRKYIRTHHSTLHTNSRT
jgi:hypothetical protein